MSDERGGAAVVALAVSALLAVLTVGLTAVGLLLSARVQATTAADAAALAAAVATYRPSSEMPPSQAAAVAASANGADLRRCDCTMDPTLRVRIAEVVVSVDIEVPFFGTHEVRGAARAEFDPARWLGR